MTSADMVKSDIDKAMENRYARVSILIGESIRNALDLLDQQPAAVIEAMIEHTKQLQLSGNAPKHRYRVRAAIIEYAEERLHEAQQWERQLAQAIAGAPPPAR
jgi:hypothetical protein